MLQFSFIYDKVPGPGVFWHVLYSVENERAQPQATTDIEWKKSDIKEYMVPFTHKLNSTENEHVSLGDTKRWWNLRENRESIL
jgi:hypothetical protein